MTMKLLNLTFCALSAFALCSCVAPNVEVSIAPELDSRYGFRPSLEVDIAAAGGEEAKRAGNANMDKYFAPKSAMRTALTPETLTFSVDSSASATLGHRHECWKRWAEKDPETLFLFVNLPHAGDDPKSDGRRIAVDYSKSFLFAETLRFRVTPAGIVRVK